MDEKKFLEIIYGLGELYDKELTKNVINIYYEVFKDYTTEQFQKAIGEVVRSHKYSTLPKPAEILEFIEGTRDDRAMIAWLSVRKAIEQYGYTDTVEFEDPIISHCIFQMGGWIEVCQVLNKDIPFMEKEFMDLYRLYEKREIKTPVKLSGYYEITNKSNGFLDKIPAPKRIELPKNLKLIKE
jgi:hypothetical protein